MKYVEVVAEAGFADNVSAIAEKHEVADIRHGEVGEDGKLAMRLHWYGLYTVPTCS